MAELEIPLWVPRLVAEAACKAHDTAINAASSNDHLELDHLKLLLRLISDVRMKAVWTELNRKKKGGHAFLFAAIDLAPATPSEFHPNEFICRKEWLQNVAFQNVFERSFWLGKLATRQAVNTAAEARIVDLRNTAEKLRKDASFIAQTFSRKDGISPLYADARDIIERAANAYDRIAINGFTFDPHAQAAQVFCMGLVSLMSHLFGHSLKGIVAKIATVVLESEIGVEQIKEWERGHWGLAPRNRASRPPT